MSELPFHLLQSMASKAEQLRYIVGGTGDQYLVPEELLNDAWHFCERARQPATWNALSASQRGAVAALEAAIDGSGDFLDLYVHATTDRLVNRDPHWADIRRRAGEALAAFDRPVPD